MEKHTLETLINEGKSTYQIADFIGCSQSNIRHWLKKHKLQTQATNDELVKGKCIVCDNDLVKQQVMFCSTACKQKKHHQRTKQENANTSYNQYYRGNDRKSMLVLERGGGCEICGYDKNIAALHFHHRGEKKFVLDMRNLGNLSLDTIREEASKCMVLCGNCHAEEHYPQFKDWQHKYKERENLENKNHLKTKEEKAEANKNYCGCGTEISYGSSQCKPCLSIARRANRPSVEQLREDLETMSFVAVGKKYGVSDNAVRKWLK